MNRHTALALCWTVLVIVVGLTVYITKSELHPPKGWSSLEEFIWMVADNIDYYKFGIWR